MSRNAGSRSQVGLSQAAMTSIYDLVYGQLTPPVLATGTIVSGSEASTPYSARRLCCVLPILTGLAEGTFFSVLRGWNYASAS